MSTFQIKKLPEERFYFSLEKLEIATLSEAPGDSVSCAVATTPLKGHIQTLRLCSNFKQRVTQTSMLPRCR